MYGFECRVEWRDRFYDVQIVYLGTSEDDPYSLDRVLDSWGTTDPIVLAREEIAAREQIHRADPSSVGSFKIAVWACYGLWKDDDPSEPTWSPPQPSTREILEAIADGHATDIVHGWDT